MCAPSAVLAGPPRPAADPVLAIADPFTGGPECALLRVPAPDVRPALDLRSSLTRTNEHCCLACCA